MNQTLSADTTLSHYRIVSRIGAGGMGEVYLAHDIKLDRSIALKILPAEVASDHDRMNRFVQEAKAASALNHPNIITIHEVDQIDSVHFIATEFIDGETLRERMRNTPVTLSEALDVATQIASALSAAHAAGIIHRDIKPENIMIRRDGIVKVLDFGLAKLTETKDARCTELEAPTLVQIKTTPGLVLGTVTYMSPEQARGREVDARSDIFSLGVVMFEMLARRSPFAGDTTSDVIAAILTTEPGPASSLNQEVPPELDRIVSSTLTKERDERYQSAGDLLADLRRLQRRLEFAAEAERELAATRQIGRTEQAESRSVSTGARVSTVEPRNSIAVLPFANLSAVAENEYFCDGLAEELLNALAKIDELKVAARTSAFSFKGRNANVSEIASTLKVNTVLEGSVRMSVNRIRITAQLINATDGYHLWSERYDCEMKDIFDVQDEITLAVVEALKVKLLGEEQAVVLKRHTRNAEAHEFYLRGLSYTNRFTPDGFQKAVESFQRAIAIDPRYTLAYAGLANAYSEVSFFSFSGPGQWMLKARAAANKALELDDALGEAHNSLAVIKMYYDWDYAGAEEEFKRATVLNPGSALIHNWYGWYLGLMGRFDESLKELQHAQELDPLAPTINSAIGIILHWSRQPERAIEQFRKVLELNPNYLIADGFLAETYEQKGDFVSAIVTIEKVLQSANDPFTLSTAGYVYAKSGEPDKALEILSKFENGSNQEYVSALHFAQIYAGLGDNEQALAALDKACDERSVWMTFLKVDPKFDPLRSDARFKDVMRRVGLPQ